MKLEYRQGIYTLRERTEYIPVATAAIDTETHIYFDGRRVSTSDLDRLCEKLELSVIRERVTTKVWCWQCYDEYNGFFATSDFIAFCEYLAKIQLLYGWVYNAKFDFSQIDYQILTDNRWKQHIKKKGKAYNRGQAWTYESTHNDMGARYAYKLWIPYRSIKNRHKHVHPVELRDMMNIFGGGLASMLESLKVTDNEGNAIRKGQMDYQGAGFEELTENDIEYIVNDVKGLYFAIKQYDEEIRKQSCGECCIFGKGTNIMTAGGFAKRELLRSLYPELTPSKRKKQFQREHPMTATQDKYYRDNFLYRGGICVVNPRYQGLLLTCENIGSLMRRYDVNSEYPYAMEQIRDLINEPIQMSYKKWLELLPEVREEFECILIIESAHGFLRDGFIPVWYDPKRRNYVKIVDEDFTHLMFERELEELEKWYDIETIIENVILYERGERVYSPFVQENYPLKAELKKQGNKAGANVVKLKLNSSYGKISERCERKRGSYKLNETGVVRYVDEGIEVDENSLLSIVVGSLITAFARIWLLSHIREICKGDQMTFTFVYCDTDSIHTFEEYPKADKYSLGGFKLEAECIAVKYLAPKAYIDITAEEYETHSKGVNVRVINETIEANKGDDIISYIDHNFNYETQYKCLQAINVKGGKALVTVRKYLATPETDPHNIPINEGTGFYFNEI